MDRAQARLTQEVVLEHEVGVYAGAASPLAGRDGIVPDEILADRRLIAMGALSGLPGLAREVLELPRLEGEAVFMNANGDATPALHLLSSTDVMCVLPRRLVALLPGPRRFREVREPPSLPQRNVAVWTSSSKQDLPQIRRLREHVAGFARSIA